MAEPESIEAVLKECLAADSDLNPIVGTRIYPCVVGEDQLPAITYQRMGTKRGTTMISADGLIGARVTLKLWSQDYDQTKTMFRAVRDSLNGWKGRRLLGATTFDVRRLVIEEPGEHDDWEDSPAADGAVVFACVVPLLIEHTETVVVHTGSS